MAETRMKSKTHHEDLISKLPDEILTRILSFVNTNSAIATSVLSKRWKLVWVSVPNLEFGNNKCTDYWDERSGFLDNSEIVDFENYVDRILSLNNVVSVRNLKLDCHNTHVSRAASWLESLAMRKAERYHLYLPRFSLIENILLPGSFFNHQKSLVELNFRNAVVEVPSTVCLPCLRTITLNHVKLVGDETMKNLLSGCPVITDLFVRVKEKFQYKKLCICSSALRNLQIHAYCDEIMIDAPNLSYLHLENQAGKRYEIMFNLPSLLKASLIIREKNKEFLYELLGKISRVEELILDGHTTKALSRSCRIQPSMLPNLTHLTVSITKEEEVHVWLSLLAHTLLGVSIIFKLVGSYRQSGWCNNRPLNLPRSIKSRITSVKIVEVHGYEWMSVVTCNLDCASGSNQLIFHGLPTSNIRADGFLRKFLPVSNESK